LISVFKLQCILSFLFPLQQNPILIYQCTVQPQLTFCFVCVCVCVCFSVSLSPESSVEGDSDTAIFLRGKGGGENPRLKKRRLFNGPQQQTTSTAFSSDDDMGEEGDAPPAPAPVQDTMMLTVPPALLKVPKLETLSLSLSRWCKAKGC
jgi:hypothetical protein